MASRRRFGLVRIAFLNCLDNSGVFADRGPIKLGTAHFDPGRCLPYSKNTPCVVCEEVCPTSPKAIYAEPEMRPLRNGRRLVLAGTDRTVTVSESPRRATPPAPPSDSSPTSGSATKPSRFIFPCATPTA